MRIGAGRRKPCGCGLRRRQRSGRPRRPPPRQTRRCTEWPPAAPRPLIFFSQAGETPREKFFCLPSNILVAKILAANQYVANYFATKQFQRRDFNQPQPNLPPQSELHSQTKRPPLLLSSHAPLLLTQTPPSLQRSSLSLALSSLARSSSKNETQPSQTLLIPFAFETLTLKIF